MIEPLKLFEAIMYAGWSWDNPTVDLTYGMMDVNARWVDGTDEDPLTLILVVPDAIRRPDVNEEMELALETASLWFSEATNDDACDVEIRVIAAHLDRNPETRHLVTNEGDVVIIARIHDWLT
jgi:hypothetical protein